MQICIFLPSSIFFITLFLFFKLRLVTPNGTPTPVLLPGKSHGRRSLAGCSPLGRKELDMTEWLPLHFSLSCIGEGNGNPLQCSCLENPRDWGAWWAAVYGVTQSRTQLKWLSSSSSSIHRIKCTYPKCTPSWIFSNQYVHGTTTQIYIKNISNSWNVSSCTFPVSTPAIPFSGLMLRTPASWYPHPYIIPLHNK